MKNQGSICLVVLCLVSVVVSAKEIPYIGEPVQLPLVLYDECDREGVMPYVAAGWMGDVQALEREECSEDNPHSGINCIKITCSASRKWYGVVWQASPHDWGEDANGYDLRKAKKLTFWARGARGGERIEFKYGIIGPGVPFPDSCKGKPKVIKLKPRWTQYTIYVTGDKRCIKTGFSWSASGISADFTFYLDDIQYE